MTWQLVSSKIVFDGYDFLRLFVDHFFFLNLHNFECQSANSNLHFFLDLPLCLGCRFGLIKSAELATWSVLRLPVKLSLGH